MNTLPAIMKMLMEMSIEIESAADGLLARLNKMKFVVACFILQKCFLLCKCVSEYFQCKEIDLVSAVSSIQSLLKPLQSLITD